MTLTSKLKKIDVNVLKPDLEKDTKIPQLRKMSR